ncbi:hypothetical protein B7982_10745 [Fibrobacter sp. UWB2]|uniref:O-antigen ligase family protein n=1 Tax=Fibrobacter sp. UWB2 TaxID=1964358 RepID=UPI000B528F20|nr:O-antigen ligase family protein [Fibrobacter sp. UWB2]OWV21583.1 hypothetical protein B7982_10745 [Fibrobacter sp. UWB2]
MISYLVGAYLAFALVNFRVAVLLMAPLSLLLHMFPAIDRQVTSILDLCCLGLTILLPIKSSFIPKIKTYPFVIPSIVVALSFVITNLFAESHWPSTVFTLNTIYVFPFVVWCVLDDEKDLNLLVRLFMIYFGFCTIYALIELALGDNLIIESIRQLDIVNANVWNYTEIRFGFKRLQSIFDTPMSMGLAMGTFGYLLIDYWKLNRNNNFFIGILMALCLVLPWLTGSRSVFAAVLVMLMPALYDYLKGNRFALLKIGLIGGGIFLFGGWVMTLVDSFIHSDTAVTGSSMDMRLMQYLVILPFFFNSPIWGNGYGFTWTFVKEVDADILGAESIWLQLLVDYGALGAIAYIACLIYMVKCLKPYFGKKACFFPLAIAVGYTLSTFLGLEINYFFIICMIIKKLHEIYGDANTESSQDA